ncbi:MAG: hypothetical protein JSW28_08610 [Thermoplasmata archaeon]|nr:MAG: hypothetical protein JSW28_08610 [Thermoplasmata archaeon]
MSLTIKYTALKELGKEHSLPILEILYLRGWVSASEAAREMGVHIATAQSYLESMKENKIIKARVRQGKSKLVEYSLHDKQMQVDLNLEKIMSQKCEIARNKAKDYFVREKKKARVTYRWDEEQRKILEINFMEKSKAFGRIGVSRTLQLSDVEGKFLWFLPQSTEKPKNVLKIAEKAELKRPEDLIQIIDLLEFLAEEKIIELEKGGK